MEKKKLKKIKIRELTKNEKLLITSLGFLLFLWITFNFLLKAQAEKLDLLEREKNNFEYQILENNETLKKEKTIDEELKNLDSHRSEILKKYFPTLDQAQIIYLLNSLLEEENVLIEDMNFSRAAKENVGDLQAKQMSVNVPFSGEYNGIMNIIKSLNDSGRRIVLDRISLDQDGNFITGNMDLKIYSLEGIAESDPDIIYIDKVSNDGVSSPFSPYEDHIDLDSNDDDDLGIEGEGTRAEDLVKDRVGEILHDFEMGTYTFIPSSPLVKGSAISSTNRKSGRHSLRLEYNILALEKENRAYIDLSKSEIILKISPESLRLWVHAYGYSPGTLGMTLKGQAGEKFDVKLAEGIEWMGWKHIEISLPEDLSLYPLKIENIYFEISYNRDDYGVLLLDKLEAFYPENVGVRDGRVDQVNDFYVVKPGDNITQISRDIYGTSKYKNEIMAMNDIKAGELLLVGRVLVLKRR